MIGEWVEKRWTPLSRAIDRGLDAIVMLFRDALNSTKFNGTQLHHGPSGPSNATNRHLQPQSVPPINNLMDTPFANTYGGPSTSSGDFMTRNLNTGSLVLGTYSCTMSMELLLLVKLYYNTSCIHIFTP